MSEGSRCNTITTPSSSVLALILARQQTKRMSSQSSHHADNSDQADSSSMRCTKKHRVTFLPCEMAVVYEIPFTCGKCYIGQTEKCINERLRQHQYNLICAQSSAACDELGGTLVKHCLYCGCAPDFYSCQLIARGADREARETVEAMEIRQAGVRCVSYPSTVPSEYPNVSKTHSRDESDSESGSEFESGSEPTREPIPEPVREPVPDSVREPVAESRSEMSPRLDVLGEDLVGDFAGSSVMHSRRAERLMEIIQILEIMK